MVQEIPDDIYDFVSKTVVNYSDITISMKDIHDRNVFGNNQTGSGFCIKYGVKAINHKEAGSDKIMIEFTISDGEYSVRCFAHNANEKYLEGALQDEELEPNLLSLKD